MTFMMIFINILFVSFLACSAFVLVTQFSNHSIMALLSCYLIFSIMLLYFHMEILAILLILIYAGAVMILFMFFLFLSENAIVINAKKVKVSIFKLPTLLFIISVISLIFIVPAISVNKMQFITTPTLNFFVLLISTNNIHLKLVRWVLFMLIHNNAPIIGFSTTPLLSLGSLMYIAFYIHSLITFLVLLSVLLSITTILTDSDIFKYLRSSKKKKKFKSYTINSLFFLIEVALNFSSFGFFISLFMNFCIFSIFFLLLLFVFNSSKSISLLRFIIFMELILLPIIGLFVSSSMIWANADGLVFSILLLSLFASESALGLSILTLQKTAKILFK